MLYLPHESRVRTGSWLSENSYDMTTKRFSVWKIKWNFGIPNGANGFIAEDGVFHTEECNCCCKCGIRKSLTTGISEYLLAFSCFYYILTALFRVIKDDYPRCLKAAVRPFFCQTPLSSAPDFSLTHSHVTFTSDGVHCALWLPPFRLLTLSLHAVLASLLINITNCILYESIESRQNTFNKFQLNCVEISSINTNIKESPIQLNILPLLLLAQKFLFEYWALNSNAI